MSAKFLTTGSWSDEPNGYMYQSGAFCPDCITETLISAGIASPGARDMAPIDVFEQCAAAQGFDTDDEYSYDSDDFPKLITTESNLTCYNCGKEL